MQYRSIEQIASEADICTMPSLSRRDRLEHWAEALARQPAPLHTIPEVEYGPRRERDARRADHSPLTVAYEDPLLRAAGLCGDTIGDAAEFFGLSHAQLHYLVCSCHHGLAMDPQATAARVRNLAQRADACTAAITNLAAVAASIAALTAAPRTRARALLTLGIGAIVSIRVTGSKSLTGSSTGYPFCSIVAVKHCCRGSYGPVGDIVDA